MFQNFALLALGFCAFSSIARADLVSIECGENRGNSSIEYPAEIRFDADDTALGENATWSLTLSGKSVKGPKSTLKAAFRSNEKFWHYIVTQAPKAEKSAARQFVFKVAAGCQESGDTGTVSIWKLAPETGRSKVASLPCLCTAD